MERCTAETRRNGQPAGTDRFRRQAGKGNHSDDRRRCHDRRPVSDLQAGEQEEGQLQGIPGSNQRASGKADGVRTGLQNGNRFIGERFV